MVKTQIAYICDCCGRKVDMEYKTGMNIAPYMNDEDIPDGWRHMVEPFGLCCDHCMNAFMNVYDSLRR